MLRGMIRGYTFVIKLHTLYIMDTLKYISSRLLISDFINWVKASRGVSFNHNLFRRAKVTDPEQMTDRQKLLLEFAQEFVQIQEEKHNENVAVQMSAAG